MRSRRRGDRMGVNGEINVVSLIDVMMLLMVIFMITAPIMQGGVDVSLPKAESRALEAKSGLIVTIDARGNITVDENLKLSEKEFAGSIKALAAKKGKDGVYLRADEHVDYGVVARVLGILQKNSIEVGLITEPAEDDR